MRSDEVRAHRSSTELPGLLLRTFKRGACNEAIHAARSRRMNQAFFERLRRALAPQYRLERELGGGGMGTVYLARDANLDIPVAIKVMRPEIATATATERFLLEARILARLRHPNIVQVHFADERDGLSFYVMDYLEGESLERRLEKGALSESAVINLGQDLLAALEAAHELGVVHRDIKPSNIKFLPGDRGILIDFGIAQSVDQERTRLTPSDQWSPATLAYAAPEQLAGEEATVATDIYALGMVLFEAATGRRWITGASPGDVDWTGVRGRLARALRRGLAPAPTKRWSDAASFREALSGRPGVVTRGRVAALATIAGLAVTVYFLVGPSDHRPERPERDIALLPFEVPAAWEMESGIGGREYAIGVARELGSTIRISVVPTQESFHVWDSLTATPTDLPERLAAEPLNADYAARVEISARNGDDSLEAHLIVYKRSRLESGLSPVRVPRTRPERLSGKIALALAKIVLEDSVSGLPAKLSESWEATKAYLLGEERFQHGAWDPAVRHYEDAVKADSTFMLALWGLANAYRWLLEEGPLKRDFQSLHERYGARLGPVDSMLMAAQLAPAGERRFAIYEEAQKQDDLYYFAAYLHGEELFNRGPLFGRPLQQAVRVLDQAATLNRGWTATHMHRAWAYIRLGQATEADTAVVEGERAAAAFEDVGLLHPVVFRFAILERFKPDLARRARETLFADTGLAVLERLAVLSRFAGSIGVPRSQLELGEMLVRRSPHIPSYRADGHIAQGLGFVGLGQLDSATVHFDSMAAILATPEARLQAGQWRLIPPALIRYWGLATDSASAAEARESLWAMYRTASDSMRLRIAWTLMLDAYGRNDTTAAGSWEDSLTARAGSLDTRPLSGLARALRRAARGDFDDALNVSEPLLGYQVRTRLLGGDSDAAEQVHDDFDRSVLHLLRARWQQQLEHEDWDGVEREIMWYEAADIDGNPRGAPPQAGEIDWALGVFAEYLRGLNDMRRGDESAACAHLGHAIETWRDAEPPFLELVGPMRLSRPRDCETVPGEFES